MKALVVLLVVAAIASAQEFPCATGVWDADSLGNHRFVIRVDTPAPSVSVRIPWRRRDLNPEAKHIFIVDGMTGRIVTQYRWTTLTRETGEAEFVPTSGAGVYYVHYLLYRPKGSRNYPKGTYLPFSRGDESFPKPRRQDRATVVRYEAIDDFNSFWPMEFIATDAERTRMLRLYPREPYVLFGEPRERPIRMGRNIPARWAKEQPFKTLRLTADRGEFLSFQVGLYAALRGVTVSAVSGYDLIGPGGARIPASAFTSFNTAGVDWQGRAFAKSVSVDSGRVQSFWAGIHVPADARPGSYQGAVSVEAEGAGTRRVPLEVTVSDRVLGDAGDSSPSRLSRLRWLNSQLAADDSVVRPFTPVRIDGSTLSILGRDLQLTPNGMPAQIRSYYSPENTRLVRDGRSVLTAPMRFVAEDGGGTPSAWTSGTYVVDRQAPGLVAWSSSGAFGPFEAGLRAKFESDGYAEFHLTLTAARDAEVRDLRLEIPWDRSAAKYMMGLGEKGGFRPDSFSWRWDQKKNHDAVWLGDVNAGMQVSLRDENYVRPLNTNFYLLKPLQMPLSWYNNGAGSVRFSTVDDRTLFITASSGPRAVRRGDTLHFIWSILITPFKLLDTDAQWTTRYFHRLEPLDSIRARGANVVNVHHANAVNPFINYPFLSPDTMRAYADAAHERGMRMKIYYTVRELTNRAPEMPMLFSLGDEVLSSGAGGGFAWLQEHLDQDYIAAWFVPELKDAAVINSGVSRWHNFYVEGLDWLVRNVGIDGLYIDDVAFDRVTMKRVRKTLDRHRPAAMIDLHSANQYNVRDGFVNSANLYLEHFPYLDRLWFGEYFDYDAKSDFWMVEVSGIPFGLMGEMLEKGGNPWRGAVFGMTARLPWAGDPRPVWQLWDAFGMEGSTMFGYWSPDCPVRTSHPDVKATVYQKPGKAMIALASWADDTVEVKLTIDWRSMGLDPSKVRMYARAADGFQPSAAFARDGTIPCVPGKGWLIEVSAAEP